MLREATEDDINKVANIAKQNRKWLGFVMNVALIESVKKKSLYVYEENNEIIGFAHFHKRLDGWTTLHEIAVAKDHQHKGIGQQLLSVLETPVRLKTTIDNENAVTFYKKFGFEHTRNEQGKKRELMVFEKFSPEPEIRERQILEVHLKLNKPKKIKKANISDMS